jgi:hypothetical protein
VSTSGFGVSRAAVLVCLVVVALANLASPRSVAAQLNVTGQWQTLPYAMPINPIHVMLLRTGKILITAGSENDPAEHDTEIARAALWDLSSGTFTMYDLPWDLFCNGAGFLPDGRAIVVGGTEQYDPFTGEPRATVFDPATEQFVQVESMAHGRWYATTTPLGDGRILTFSGLNEADLINQAVELYTIAGGWSAELPAPWAPPLFPWLHLLPDGRVFASGANPDSHFFDPATATWTSGPVTNYGQIRTYGSSVLLGLNPPDYTPRVLIMGGNDPATATVEMIDLSSPTPAWQFVPDMSGARIEMNATLLPNGKVLASGGSARDEDGSTAIQQADLFDPDTQTWSSAGTAAFPRLYHSVAMLLPDATVVTAGSNPERGVYDQRIEIWTPPYLFTETGAPAPRPRITAVPNVIGYNSAISVQTPDAADIASVVLMRPGSPTHAFDMEQRLIGLTFTPGGGTLTVASPPTPNIAPPGYYMMFILNSRGVPSIARFVQLTPLPNDQPPTGTMTQPATDVTVEAGQPVTFTATAVDADGTVPTYAWIFPQGTPASLIAPSGAPVDVTFPTPGTYVVSLTVVDNDGVNDPSPDTRVVTVTPAATGSPTLGLGASTVLPGGTVNVTWSGIESPTPGDWIGLYASGADDNSFQTWIYVSCSQTRGAARASGSCPFSLPSTLAPGRYEVRLFSDDGFSRIATSQTLTVSGGSVTLTASPSTIMAGGTVAASWSRIESPTALDWIGLYAPGAADTDIQAWVYVSCSPTPGAARGIGSCPFDLPPTLPLGTYELRLYMNDGFSRLGTSNTFTVTSGLVILSEAPSTMAAGGTVTAAWSHIESSTPLDWIGLYAPGADDTAFLTWVYAGCAQTPGAAKASGSCPLSLPGTLAPGLYELRLYTNDGFTRLATSGTFTVTSSPVSLTEGASTVAPGGEVTATWNAIVSPTALDWIGLYAPGASDTDIQAWIYVSCSQSPGTARAAGSCAFSVPPGVSPGRYELRLYANDLYNLLATGSGFTVTP